MKKNAQLSMEMVMIYGAIILVVTLAIGALIYFGVLDIGSLLPDKCSLGGKITCEAFSISQNNGIQLEFINRIGKNIEISNIEVVGLDDWTGKTASVTYSTKKLVSNGQKFVIGDTTNQWTTPWNLANTFGKIKGEIIITYNVAGSTLIQQEKGEIQAKIAS